MPIRTRHDQSSEEKTKQQGFEICKMTKDQKSAAERNGPALTTQVFQNTPFHFASSTTSHVIS